MIDHISVCVCTYRRNTTLSNLLRKLAQQKTQGEFAFSVVVVDNDAAGPARKTVTSLQEELDMDITYGIEPVNTIPAARNHALALARGNYIGIIDDDEFPPPDWLLRMYRAIHTFDVDGTLGPVFPFFSNYPPKWLVKGCFCERPTHKTGTLLHWDQTRTGNVLLKKDVFIKHNLQFDENCRTSGSDKEFFREAMAVGCRFVAVEEAPVFEVVPPPRQTKSYYLRRALIQASNERRFRAPHLKGASRILVPAKVTVAFGVYALALPFSALMGTHARIKCLLKLAYHLSWLLAMVGVDLAKKRDM